ncbi:hypothetical protein [Falsiroseomonas tokyonensis]|uniref:XRE family transcriptional regulator n=1 Tax=Falsiroseomonas tokyonensis TaxID=430521 RepID=A0ABV7C3U5_9PROT|nr:hypothetical protein [Falsiroseomonas tokyonensis]MBU8540838.1 hypothetical protein [Falsiroseomonas tokyonensis]
MSATTTDTSILRSLFRDAYPKNTAKHVARAANAPVATAQSWVSGRFTPSALTLLKMAAACERMAFTLERYLDATRDPAMADSRAEGLRAEAQSNGAPPATKAMSR